MGMQFGSETRRRRILIALGLLLAAIAAVGAFMLVNRPAAPPAQVPTTPVLVAVAAIPPRTAVLPGQIAVREVPQTAVLPQALTDVSQALGRFTVVQIYAGQQITPNLFGDVGAIDFSILDPEETIEPNSPFWRAIAVTMTPDRAVGGLHAGQFIDLIVTAGVDIQGIAGCVEEEGSPAPASPGTVPGPAGTPGVYCSGLTTKVTFENMRILHVPPESDTYILRVDLHQAEELAYMVDSTQDAESPDYTFTAVLRPDRDTRVIDRLGYGETGDRVIRQYRWVIPEILYLFEFVPNPAPGAAVTPGPVPPPAEIPTTPEPVPSP
jgi:Flp pilus assembly protein CpaB